MEEILTEFPKHLDRFTLTDIDDIEHKAYDEGIASYPCHAVDPDTLHSYVRLSDLLQQTFFRGTWIMFTVYQNTIYVREADIVVNQSVNKMLQQLDSMGWKVSYDVKHGELESFIMIHEATGERFTSSRAGLLQAFEEACKHANNRG